jgi:membrane protease YdiL (CAAX protease family)
MAEEGNATKGESTEQGLPRCSSHDSRPATAMCVSCARPVCKECDRVVGYRHYCPECFPRFSPPVPYAYQYPVPYPYAVPPPPLVPMRPPEPADARERRWWMADWGLGEVLISLIIIFGLYNVLSVLLLLSTDDLVLISYISYAVFFCPLIALSTWIIVRRHGRGRKELGLQWGKPRRTLAFGGLGGLAAVPISYGAFAIIYFIFYLIAGRGPVSAESEQMQQLSGGYLALVIFTVVVLAPIFEELFFRGLFYPALRNRMGKKWAILLNGMIFGAMHFQPLFMISLVLVGITLAYIYEKTDSLFASMLTHALYNGAVILMALLLGW